MEEWLLHSKGHRRLAVNLMTGRRDPLLGVLSLDHRLTIPGSTHVETPDMETEGRALHDSA